jgi:hypothetical protein
MLGLADAAAKAGFAVHTKKWNGIQALWSSTPASGAFFFIETIPFSTRSDIFLKTLY